MKQVYSKKTTIGFLLFGLIVFIGFLCFNMIAMVFYIQARERHLMIITIIGACYSLIAAALFIFVLNRDGCKVLYDSDTNTLYRKGFWWGYKYQLKVEDIIEIIVVCLPMDDTYYIFVDPYSTKYESHHKKSFIRIKETRENLEFIKQFWDKPINTNEYRGIDGYSKLVTKHRSKN